MKLCIGGINKPCPNPAEPVFCYTHNHCILRKLRHGLTFRDIATQYELPVSKVAGGFRNSDVSKVTQY